MPTVADWKRLASSGLLVLIFICCFGPRTPLAAGNEPQNAVQQCKPKSVLVDVKDNTRAYHIPYSVCAHQNPACEGNGVCDDPQGKITEALLYMGDSGNVQQLPYDDQTFNVTLQGERFTKTGVDNWIVSYKYETNGETFPTHIEHCTCQVNLTLMIVVDDLELIDNLKDDDVTMLSLEESERKFQAKHITTDDDNPVTLNCSSGLQDQQTPLRFKFVFNRTPPDQLSINEEYDRTVWCNETSDGTTPYPNWKITRLDDACLLRLTEFSQMDNGTYGCILYHPDSNSHYNDDFSNTIYLISPTDTKPASAIINVIFVVTVTIGALIGLLIVSAVSGYAVYYNYHKHRVAPTQQGRGEEQLHDRNYENYGTFSEKPGRNLSRPTSPVHHLILVQTQQKQPIEPETAKLTGQSADQEAQESADQDSDTSSADSNVLSDIILTTLALTGEKDTPPCNHPDRGACVKNLICRCGKAYCIHQSHFFHRHNLKCQGAAADGQDEAGHGSGSDSSNSTTPSFEGSGHGDDQ